MFLGWIYNTWEIDYKNQGNLTTMGEFRSNFMDDRMKNWVFFSAFR